MKGRGLTEEQRGLRGKGPLEELGLAEKRDLAEGGASLQLEASLLRERVIGTK